MISPMLFRKFGRIPGKDYPAHDILESYATALYDLYARMEHQHKAPAPGTLSQQANAARNDKRLAELEEKERTLREKAEELLACCVTPDEREALRMRYMMLMDWDSIAAVLYGDEPDYFFGREYRHRALCLHHEAMSVLEKTIATTEVKP